MKAYEYRILDAINDKFWEEVNKWAEDGWRVHTVLLYPNNTVRGVLLEIEADA